MGHNYEHSQNRCGRGFAVGAAVAFAPLAAADPTDITSTADSEITSLNSLFTSEAWPTCLGSSTSCRRSSNCSATNPGGSLRGFRFGRPAPHRSTEWTRPSVTLYLGGALRRARGHGPSRLTQRDQTTAHVFQRALRKPGVSPGPDSVGHVVDVFGGCGQQPLRQVGLELVEARLFRLAAVGFACEVDEFGADEAFTQ
jgi:hypothetical protein